MIYEINIHLFLKNEIDARALCTHAELFFPKALSVNPDSGNAEFSKIELIKNHHDEQPHKPCFLLAGLTTHPLGMPVLPLELAPS